MSWKRAAAGVAAVAVVASVGMTALAPKSPQSVTEMQKEHQEQQLEDAGKRQKQEADQLRERGLSDGRADHANEPGTGKVEVDVHKPKVKIPGLGR